MGYRGAGADWGGGGGGWNSGWDGYGKGNSGYGNGSGKGGVCSVHTTLHSKNPSPVVSSNGAGEISNAILA